MFHNAPSFSGSETPQVFREMSLAYFSAAERLTNDLVAGSWAPDFYRGQVALWLAFHATELFYKACIRKATGGNVKGHSLTELQIEFGEHYPTVQFNPPFEIGAVPADAELIKMALDSDMQLHMRLRYPVDLKNAPWGGKHSFEPNLFQSDLLKLRQDMESVYAIVFS